MAIGGLEQQHEAPSIVRHCKTDGTLKLKSWPIICEDGRNGSGRGGGGSGVQSAGEGVARSVASSTCKFDGVT